MAEISELSISKSAVRSASTMRRSGGNYRWLPFWLLLPSMAVLLVVQVLPTLYSFYLSTTRVRAGQFQNVGINNYLRLLRLPSFWDSVRVTAIYAGIYIAITVVLGVMVALLLNRRIKFTGVYLIAIFIPWIISDVVVGTMWRWLFQQTYGPIQVWIDQNAPFIGHSLYTTASGALSIVIIAAIWRGLAFTTLIALGALQTVPGEIIESAALDGANRVQRFFGVILPIIRPTVLVMVLLTSIQAINSVGLIYSITKGEPGGATRTVSFYLLQTGWSEGDFGTGSAIAVLMFGANLVLTLVYLRLIGSKRD
ncbi:MAG: sugar ABC transporter permease [Chloroflexota bacterium]